MRRIAVGIQYDGSRYRGWQVQQGVSSLQATLQAALARVADAPVALICAGRTDTGVHARAQVAHFDTDAVRSPRAWLLGANTYLPTDISLSWVRGVPAHFHARYSALARTYRYLILNRPSRVALSHHRALLVYQPLDAEAMAQGAQWLVGEHDFSAFRAAECQARSPVRALHALRVCRAGEWIAIDVTANAFLHHMVRNIVGLLLAIGLGRAPPQRAQDRLASRLRTPAEITAAAHGLYLWQVHYPAAFGLPADSAMIGSPAFEEPARIGA
jgi:tRNA pseudouridine38-40 synthase